MCALWHFIFLQLHGLNVLGLVDDPRFGPGQVPIWTFLGVGETFTWKL